MAISVRHFVDIDDFTHQEIVDVLDLAVRQKADPSSYRNAAPLKGEVVGLFFEKPSLRTRLGFEVAIYQLGGQLIYMSPDAVHLGTREALKDFAHVSARFLSAMVLRTLKHESIVEIAKYSNKPVINGLSDKAHPCQAIADILTIREKKGRLKDIRVAYVGDANNVCVSLARALVKCGATLVVAAPPGYQLKDAFIASLDGTGKVERTEDPNEGVAGADVVYTDVWTSMGQEQEQAERARVFKSYQINAALMAHAPEALVMHCLPAHRGHEITDEVIDSKRSIVFDQAENRLHVQRALLCKLMNP